MASSPNYISDLLIWYVPSCPLRSANGALLVIPRSQLVTNADRAFAIRAPTLWNSLQADIRHTQSLTDFKFSLKHILLYELLKIFDVFDLVYRCCSYTFVFNLTAFIVFKSSLLLPFTFTLSPLSCFI